VPTSLRTRGRPAAIPPTSASTAPDKGVIVFSDVANSANDLGVERLINRKWGPTAPARAVPAI